MKIKITKQDKELEGEIEEGNVTPSGNSAHIPFSKKHMAKIVSVIIPSKPQYVWLLSNYEKSKLISSTGKIIRQENGKLEYYREGLLNDLSNENFELDSLIKIVSLLESKGKERDLVRKIKKLYSL